MAFEKRPPIAENTTKAIPEYFASKNEEQNIIKHYPEWDVIKGEPVIELMRVCREFRVVDADWVSKRIEYQNRREQADQQWQDLREKEKWLRLSFIKFDDFIKENREKRERAEIKIRDQIEMQKIREIEINEFEKTLKSLEKIRRRMQSCVEEYEPFQQYLESVIRSSKFNSIAEIFNRYETLIDARKSLEESQSNNLQILENTSAQLQKMTEERSQNLMDLNSRLAQLQSRHGSARAQTLHWEAMVSRIKELAARKEFEDTRVRSCIWNLYRQICKRKDIPMEAKSHELEQQLLVIKRTIIELGKIVALTKHRAAREKKLAERQRGGSEIASTVKRDETRSSFRSSVDVRSMMKN